MQQEKQVSGGVTYQDKSKVLVNATTTRNQSYIRGKGLNANKICTPYGRTGHTIDVCYRKHEFPPSFKFKNAHATHNVFQDIENDMKHNQEEPAPKVEGLQ